MHRDSVDHGVCAQVMCRVLTCCDPCSGYCHCCWPRCVFLSAVFRAAAAEVLCRVMVSLVPQVGSYTAAFIVFSVVFVPTLRIIITLLHP